MGNAAINPHAIRSAKNGPMTSIQFVMSYIEILEELDHAIKPEMYPAIRSLYVRNPHDLITPNTWFPSRDAAVGFVWRLLLKRAKEITEVRCDGVR